MIRRLQTGQATAGVKVPAKWPRQDLTWRYGPYAITAQLPATPEAEIVLHLRRGATSVGALHVVVTSRDSTASGWVSSSWVDASLRRRGLGTALYGAGRAALELLFIRAHGRAPNTVTLSSGAETSGFPEDTSPSATALWRSLRTRGLANRAVSRRAQGHPPPATETWPAFPRPAVLRDYTVYKLLAGTRLFHGSNTLPDRTVPHGPAWFSPQPEQAMLRGQVYAFSTLGVLPMLWIEDPAELAEDLRDAGVPVGDTGDDYDAAEGLKALGWRGGWFRQAFLREEFGEWEVMLADTSTLKYLGRMG